jgi:hypothetical protein
MSLIDPLPVPKLCSKSGEGKVLLIETENHKGGYLGAGGPAFKDVHVIILPYSQVIDSSHLCVSFAL